MTEISKEAWEEARAILGATGGSIIDIVAVALQRHMDETAQADRCLRIAAGGVTKWKERAEAAERAYKAAETHIQKLEKRAEAAEAAHLLVLMEYVERLERTEAAEARAQQHENTIAELRAQLAMGGTK